MFVLIEPLVVYAVLFNNKKGIDLENNVQISFQYYWIPGAHNVFVKKKKTEEKSVIQSERITSTQHV